MDKNILRAQIKQCKKEYSFEELERFSHNACLKLESQHHFQQAKTVLLYASLPDEVNTTYLLEKWYKQKTIILPKVVGDHLTLHIYNGKECMQVGAYNILEPTTPSFEDFAQIDVAIIPGVAFTPDGKRLGRGKGYYDRLLSHPDLQHVYKIGLAFPFQIVADIPTNEWDIKMNEVES